MALLAQPGFEAYIVLREMCARFGTNKNIYLCYTRILVLLLLSSLCRYMMARIGLNEEVIRPLLSIIGDERDDGLDKDDNSYDPT